MYKDFEEFLASSKKYGAIEELARLIKIKFKLEDEEIYVEIGNCDRLFLCGKCAMGKATERYAKLMPRLQDYCEGYLDGLEFEEPLDAEPRNVNV